VVAHACHPSYVGSVNRKIVALANLGKNGTPYLKITKTKRVEAYLKRLVLA
jgi:hypothetical protein